jgi:hypothetical protein
MYVSRIEIERDIKAESTCKHTSEYDFSIAERFKVKFLKTQAQSIRDLTSVTTTYRTLNEIMNFPSKYKRYLHTM